MDYVDEKSFTQTFLEGCSVMELVALQHDLRAMPEDAPYLHQVLKELERRDKKLRHALEAQR